MLWAEGKGARPYAARPAKFQRAALAASLSMLCAHAFIPLLMRLCSWLVLPTTPPCASLFWVLVLPTTPAVRFSLLGALLFWVLTLPLPPEREQDCRPQADELLRLRHAPLRFRTWFLVPQGISIG